jgi:lysozyme family protein
MTSSLRNIALKEAEKWGLSGHLTVSTIQDESLPSCWALAPVMLACAVFSLVRNKTNS